MLWTTFLRSIAVVLLLNSWGCTSSPRMDPVVGPPADFVLDATILVGRDVQKRAANSSMTRWPAHLRPWRLMVLPDGSLRADTGASIDVRTRPGVTRRLYKEQVETLWSALGDLGLADPKSERTGMKSGNPALERVQPDEVLQILSVSGDGQSWTFTCRFTPDADGSGVQGEDPQLRAMLRRLLALAWATDLRPEQRFSAPERYDFGDDPWSRYR